MMQAPGFARCTPPNGRKAVAMFVVLAMSSWAWAATADNGVVFPTPNLFPRNRPPAKSLQVLDISDASAEVKLAMTSLQGIVNRGIPRIYLLRARDTDRFWLDAMQSASDTGVETPVESPRELLDRYRGEVAGGVVYDPEFPASINIARRLGS